MARERLVAAMRPLEPGLPPAASIALSIPLKDGRCGRNLKATQGPAAMPALFAFTVIENARIVHAAWVLAERPD